MFCTLKTLSLTCPAYVSMVSDDTYEYFTNCREEENYKQRVKCPLVSSVKIANNKDFVNPIHYLSVNTYGLLTKHEVKMAGYWPGFSFACSSWSIKEGFIIWDKTPKHDLCTCGTKPVSRAGKIAPSCPLG